MIDRGAAGLRRWAPDLQGGDQAGVVGPVEEVACGQRAARRVGDPLVEQRLAQLLEREVLVAQPGGEPDRGAQLGVAVAVAARARPVTTELARELGPQLPARVGRQVRPIGVRVGALTRGARPALEPRQPLVALLEDAVGEQPRAQVGAGLADVVRIDRLMGDRELAAQHCAQRRCGGASLQPGQRRLRLVVHLKPREQRREPGDRLRVAVCPQLRERGVESAARAALLAPVAALGAAVAAVLDRAGAGAGGANRRAVDPCRGPSREAAALATRAPPSIGSLAADADRSALTERRDPPAPAALRALRGRAGRAAPTDRLRLAREVAAARLAAERAPGELESGALLAQVGFAVAAAAVDRRELLALAAAPDGDGAFRHRAASTVGGFGRAWGRSLRRRPGRPSGAPGARSWPSRRVR